MSLILDNYNISRVEWCHSLLTVSAIPLATRHWAASHNAPSQVIKWGHRVVAFIEACPVLGAIAALIEIIIAKFLKPADSLIVTKTPPTVRDTSPAVTNTAPIVWDGILPFNTPFVLTTEELSSLGMQPNLRFSELPQYADSIFRTSWKNSYPRAKIIRIKNEALINGTPIQLPSVKGPSSTNEGLRVRTFCLELLSNLEDQLPLQANTNKMEELIQCVKYYLENFAFAKHAGFIDYRNFLSILMKEAPECSSIFLRHRNFVELQNSLPKSVQPKFPRWEKIRIIIRTGLFTPRLLEGAFQAMQFGLKPLPMVPQQRRIIKLYPMLDAINTLASDYREAGRWLMHKIRLITFRELCSSIKKSCLNISNEIMNWKDFTILTIPGKSQAWMADIAYRYLPLKKLAGVLSLPRRSTGHEIYSHMKQSSSHNFLIFDDGAYSCTQFWRYLDEFYEKISEKEVFATKKNLYFIFGHFPLSKYGSVSQHLKQFEKHNINIKVITNNLISSWENDKLDDITKRASELSRKGRMEVVTEWKKPDFFSTSLYITEGYQCGFSRSEHLELNVNMASIESIDGEGPIANITPPYLSKGD